MKKFLIIAACLLFAGCNTAAKENGTTSLQTSSDNLVYMSEVNVSGTDFAFSPKKILGHVGEKLVVNFTNDSSHIHNFVIPDLEISSKNLNPGEKETLEITPTTAGTYQIVCAIAGHKEQGMFGELIVK